MVMSRRNQAQSVILVLLTLAKHTTAKPTGLTDTNVRDDVDTIIPSEEYEYDWTSDSSGFLDYSDVEMFTPRYCPLFCTCVVETILYCSRQGITSIGNRQEYHDLDIKILDGPLPNTAASVHLGYNNLTSLPARLFEDTTEIGHNKIVDLYLQSNQISSVHPDAFIVLKSLRNMDLSNNRIANLVQGCDEAPATDLNASCVPGRTEYIFLRSAPRSLVSLNLNGNLIRGIPNYSFMSLPNLEVLRLSWNQITWISRKGFYGLHKLRVLQLRANPLGANTALKLGDILQHFITGELLVNQNDSSDLDSIQFYPGELALPNTEGMKSSATSGRSRQNPRNGEYDRIALNSLEDLDLGATNISKFPDVLPPSVKRLYLDQNRISTIPRRVLEPMKSLERLQLGGNRIEHFSDDTFSSMQSIRVLDLSRNHLTKLTSNSFTGLLGLISLRLYGNRQLSQLPRKVFWSLPMLRLLYLHDCNLSNLPSGPWIFRILALWLYGNPIDCNCQNLLSLKVRIHKPRHPSLDLRLDPYRSVLWDDADTWKYQRRVKTTCATPNHFRGQTLKDIQMTDMLCTYQDHYETAVSRQISWSRFLSSDYQQDESTEDHNSDTGMVEEPVMDYTYDSSESDYAVKHEEDINVSKEKSQIKETGTEMSNEKVVVPELVYLDAMGDPLNSVGLQGDGTPQKESMALVSVIAPLKNTADVIALLEENDLPSDSSAETEWVISLPGNAEIDENGQEETKVRKKLDESNVSYDYDVNPTPPLVKSSKEKFGPYDVEIEIGQQLDAKPEIAKQPRHGTTTKEQRMLYKPPDNQERMWKEHPQGFAEYPMYDDGEVDLDMISILRFNGEMDNTLSESDLLRLRTEMRNINAWRSYQEYYSDVESSGDEYDESLMFSMHANDLEEAGATEEDILGDLSPIYNSSDRFDDYGESYLTVDLSTSDDQDYKDIPRDEDS